MRQALQLHPDSTCPAVASIDVDIARQAPGALALTWMVTGDIARLRLPPPAAPVRADGLWRHSCFEVFARASGAAGYCEFNLAPSGAWAAYSFTGYRDGGTDLAGLAPPHFQTRVEADRLVLDATLDLGAASGLPADGPWRLGLSAVVEDIDGAISYWALAHPPGRADFHHPDCFALQVEAGGPS